MGKEFCSGVDATDMDDVTRRIFDAFQGDDTPTKPPSDAPGPARPGSMTPQTVADLTSASFQIKNKGFVVGGVAGMERVVVKIEGITDDTVTCVMMEYGHEGEAKEFKAAAFLAKAKHIKHHQTVFQYDDSIIALNKNSAMVSAAIALTQYHVYKFGYDLTQKFNWSESLELLKDPVAVRALKGFKAGRLKIPIGCCLCAGGALPTCSGQSEATSVRIVRSFACFNLPSLLLQLGGGLAESSSDSLNW